MDKFYKQSKISVFGVTNFSSVSSLSLSSSNEDYFEEDESRESEDVFECLYVQEDHGVGAVLKNEAYCFDTKRFAEKFVNAICAEATADLKKKRKIVSPVDVVQPLIADIIVNVISFVSESELSPSIYSFHRQPKSLPSGCKLNEEAIEWPKISEFNIKLGLEKLEDYVATWKRSKDWMFCVEFLGFESEDCSNIFVYEVCFS